MKLLTIIASMTLLTTGICRASEIVDLYDFTMSLKVPRIYNNTASLGYRKDQLQKIKGILKITYKEGERRPTFEIINLVNKTHKLSNGKNVTYNVTVDNDGEQVYPRFNYIGNNKTKKFTKAKIIFYFDANPSYNIGEDDEDNTLLITLSGSGTGVKKKKYNYAQIVTTMSGRATGTLGCGCMAYGHVSPTRIVGPYGPLLDEVDDVSPLEGTWKARFTGRYYK